MHSAFRLPNFMRLVAVLLAGLPAFAAAEVRLHVSYNGQSEELVAADLATLPAASAEVTEHGATHVYRGVAARDVLALVGAPFDKQLRGPGFALVVKVHAADGYVVAFALAEFDAAHREQTILLADRQDGAPLPANAAPWRLICPGDKRPARSVRQVSWLEVISVGTDRPAHPDSKPTATSP
jgi:DMSO/TMAO reductase YedYZ molybdopterin-dependent catalytic subunit